MRRLIEEGHLTQDSELRLGPDGNFKPLSEHFPVLADAFSPDIRAVTGLEDSSDDFDCDQEVTGDDLSRPWIMCSDRRCTRCRVEMEARAAASDGCDPQLVDPETGLAIVDPALPVIFQVVFCCSGFFEDT